MISQYGKVSFETIREMKGTQKEEVDGEVKEKEVDVTLRFDLSIPMGAPYAAVHDVLKEFDDEISKMEEAAKKHQQEEEENKAQNTEN